MEEKKLSEEKKEQQLQDVAPPQEEIKIEQEPYKVYGCDISTTNQLIKEFYQATMSMTAIANLLIGEFDDKGNYVISKEIKRDIVVMDKEIDEAGENFFKAASLYMTKNFYFLVKIAEIEDGKAKAKLFLYEYVGDFLNKEFVVSHIANFIDIFDQDFVGKVRKAFNLVDVDKPNNDFETPALAAKMQQMLDAQLQMQDLYEVTCQIFVLRMLKVLENYTKGKVIIEEFKALLAKYKGTLSFAKQKALLDKIINSMGGYDNVLKGNPEAASLLKEFIKSFNDIMKAKPVQETANDKKEDKEKAAGKAGAAKKAGAKKGGAKKAGGGAKKGGAKKAAKKGDKKDDKKKGEGLTDSQREAFRKAAEAKYGLDKKAKEEKKEEKPKVSKPKTEASQREIAGKENESEDTQGKVYDFDELMAEVAPAQMRHSQQGEDLTQQAQAQQNEQKINTVEDSKQKEEKQHVSTPQQGENQKRPDEAEQVVEVENIFESI